jgi:NitT/TauT family transport system ATP-binding protein
MSARPGRIEEIIPVDIPRPRSLDAMKDPRFHAAVDRARGLMHAAGLPE